MNKEKNRELKKEKRYKESILLLTGISMAMFFTSIVSDVAIPMKTEAAIVWWIGLLLVSVISIKVSLSSEHLSILLYCMYVLFWIISFSFLRGPYAGVVVGMMFLSMVIVADASAL